MPVLSAHVSGDADGGWITDLHDGDKQTTHMPDGGDYKSPLAALIASLRERFGEEWDALVYPRTPPIEDAKQTDVTDAPVSDDPPLVSDNPIANLDGQDPPPAA